MQIKNKIHEFLNHCQYVQGQYNEAKDFIKVNDAVSKAEKQAGNTEHGNRVFYLAIPPNVFVDVARSAHESALSHTGWNRIIVEKPFGKDLESSNKLG